MPADSGRYPSGQRGQTVNLLAYAFGGSNPPLPTIVASAMCSAQTVGGLSEVRVAPHVGGNSSVVERQPSKLGVAGSNPVSRSKSRACAHVAQSAERVLGKDEVSGSIPDMGSSLIASIATANGRT